ncbi:MAG TPA: beta-propeller domain-containing protein [Acidimicrobiales bacterium]|nr:beta-propeller domain-containing protein [Acidimicrobiales bacterium]
MDVKGSRSRTQRAAGRAARLLLGALLLTLGSPLADPAIAQTPLQTGGGAGFDGDPSTTERLLESHPTYAAVEISKLRFAAASSATGRKARHVVLSRDNTFADSVAGSALADDGPLLFTPTNSLHPATADEIGRVLPAGGRVLLLGGPAAISDEVMRQLQERGFTTERRAGATRVETAVAVAEAVRVRHPGEDVLIARAWGPTGNDTAAWADSIAGGAFAAASHSPILVTRSSGLDAPVAAWLARDTPARTTLLGGDAALSNAVAAAVPNPRRVSGAERTATAAAIATQLWGAPTSGARRFLVNNASADTGWAFGFASAGVAADANAPVLLVTSKVTEPTTALTQTCGSPQVDLLIVGDGTVVPAPMREQLDATDGYACGPRGAVVYPSNLEAFPACAAVLDHFKTTALEHVGPYGLGGYGDYAFDGGIMPISPGTRDGGASPALGETDGSSAPPAATPGDQNASGGGSSGTNVQEEGVDEPDIAKNNGTHVFSVSGSELRIVDVADGTPSLASKVTLAENGSHELLLSGNRVLVLTREFNFFIADGGGREAPEGSSFAPSGGPPSTTLTSIDITDPAQPTVLSSIAIEGDYRSARMIGSVARVVIQGDPDSMPFVYPNSDDPEDLQAAAAHNRSVIEDSTLDTWLPGYVLGGPQGENTGEGALVDCTDVHSPPIFSGLGTLSVVTVDIAGGSEPTSSASVVASGDTVYASTSRLFVSTGRWGWEADALDTGPTTEVHGFDISVPTATEYVGSGSAPGYILNQFALSEFAGHLRIATTSQPPWREPGTPIPSDNGVHVFAEQGGSLVEVGRVRGLGEGERITAVRFFGDLGAVVTFERIDPLFLLDLSNPAAPRVTGELKVPGFSSYLHRVAPDRLLGVGSSATDEGMVTGAQVSLFDISNRSAPRLVDSVDFPNGFSTVEYDHHAFLHWPATGLAVIPLYEFSETSPGFIGAVGLDVATGGLGEVGRATHEDEGVEGWDTQIARSMVVNGNLFTVSDAGIESNSLTNLAERTFLALH